MHKDEITRLVSEGKSLAEIAQLLEIPYSTIVNYRQKLGIPLPKVVREPKPKTIEVKKARTGRIKNEIFLSRIKELASQGMTRSEIARRLNTSYPLVVYYEKNHGIKIALTKA
jgi:DNA-binding CsgD family transcriptional regulator